MKKILVMVMALALAISMLATASAATELKWASVHPPEQVVTQMMMRAIDEVNEKAEGIHIIEVPDKTPWVEAVKDTVAANINGEDAALEQILAMK